MVPDDPNDSLDFTWDDNGNLSTEDYCGYSYEYDLRNRLIEVNDG